ncbi:MAG: DMT family transporter [Calothrix sp. SM1_7_51]|nr:DMT family transporter [Calothrix sp. SM1_7_51]
MHQTSGRWRFGLALSLLTVSLWGVLPIALKVTLQKLDVYTVTWSRFLLSFSLLAIYLGIKGKLPKISQISRNTWILLTIATIFLASNYILFLKGLALTGPANAEVVIQLAPLLMSFGGLVIFKERYSIFQWMGVSIITLGYLLFFHEKLQSFITIGNEYIFGSSLVILGAVTWAIYALAQKQLLRSLSSTSIMLIIYGGCALLFTPFAAPNTIFTLSFLHLFALLFCGLNTLIAYGAFAEALEHWEASRVSAVLAIAPIVTLISVDVVSVLAPKLIPLEQLTFLGIIGAVLVVSGSVVISLAKKI